MIELWIGGHWYLLKCELLGRSDVRDVIREASILESESTEDSQRYSREEGRNEALFQRRGQGSSFKTTAEQCKLEFIISPLKD